jgi:hypothetical protein
VPATSPVGIRSLPNWLAAGPTTGLPAIDSQHRCSGGLREKRSRPAAIPWERPRDMRCAPASRLRHFLDIQAAKFPGTKTSFYWGARIRPAHYGLGTNAGLFRAPRRARHVGNARLLRGCATGKQQWQASTRRVMALRARRGGNAPSAGDPCKLSEWSPVFQVCVPICDVR